ncbi:MAG: hypothetical protein ACOCXM_09510 [Myxococcota bacterium]
MAARGPHLYRSFEEFEREEIAPHKKCGWSLDDLYEDAKFRGIQEDSEDEPKELDFDY